MRINLNIANLILITILVLAAFFRLWNLSSNPPALTPDEAALGYNAYSILKTGKDEFGTKLPIVFKSFGDYKPGLYVYLTIPTVAVLGLSEFSTRLPSAIFGVLSVYLVYLIVRRIFENFGLKVENLNILSIISAFVAATNPYLIYFSRGAWEANVSLAFTLVGVFFFLESLKNEKKLYYSALFFALTLHTYQGSKLSTFLVIAVLFVVYFRDIKKISLLVLAKSIFFGILIAIPVATTLFNGQAERLTIFSILSYPRPAMEKELYAGPVFNLFHSDSLNYVRMIMSRWFNFYSGQFLFFVGDAAHPSHTPAYQGVMLLSDLILLPLGLFNLFKNKKTNGVKFLFLWMLLAPLPAALSRDQTNAVRSLSAAIPLIVTSAFGLYSLINKRFLFVFLPVFAAGFIYFIDAYFIHYPKHNAPFLSFGYKEAVEYVTKNSGDYESIVFEQSFSQPYIYFLFYNKYDPYLWQKQANLVDSEYKGDVGYEEKLGKISFEKIDWSKLSFSKNTLVVASTNSLPPEIVKDSLNFIIIGDIEYPLKTGSAFTLIKTK